ncbi:mannitol dehydrogenase family protein [Aestuariivirga litoralis]|uniref:Mannitol dehydrogenase family protein n=1 Tax=Aestuariivirga litoralis TaxID=2650924 RepID=A0A2W2CDY9_9HYPH|nr:mannitol dehydrogenase family protein [Aestuariivirga litoralis]PZF78463.1 mannitol dehydrogenase family protein [Aestuariivirga litoralis]
MTRLSLKTARPAYDPQLTDIGIVHLGVGAFHRAHQADYTDAVLAKGDRRWAILGASLRSADTRDALRQQDYLYTLAASDESGERCKVIAALRGVLVAPENPQALVEAMCLPGVKIVSLTVTEKGYCHDPATGTLNDQHPDILHDLATPDAPRSAPGFLVEAIHARKARGLPPFTVLCCDNLPANGRTVAKVVARLAELRSPALGAYVAEHVAFPATMVDRIVPATTDADRARIAAATGLDDAWPVVTEAFTDWVIEDHFPQGRPDWAARFVTDIAPFETMKLRLLNGAHSSMSYLGYLAGHETIASCMQDAALAHFVSCLMNSEVTSTLTVPPGTDVAAYKQALLGRFRNPGLRHRCWQIAMDGSQKLPQRLLGTIRDRLKAGEPIDALALGVAAWMRYVTGVDETGGAIDVRDPLKDELRARADAAGLDAERLAPALLGIEAIFGRDLPVDPRFTAAVTAALDSLIRHGSKQTYETFRSTHP